MPSIGSKQTPAFTGAVPVGGTAQQLLTKSSSTDYAADWTTSSAGSLSSPAPFLAGRWYDNRICAAPVASGTFAISANSTYYLPVFFPTNTVVTEVALGTYTTTSSIQWGVYASGADRLPGAAYQFGSFSGNAVVRSANTNGFTVQAGWAWLATGCPNATTLTPADNFAVPAVPRISTTPANGNACVGYRDTSNSGVLTANAPAATMIDVLSLLVPMIWFKVG